MPSGISKSRPTPAQRIDASRRQLLTIDDEIKTLEIRLSRSRQERARVKGVIDRAEAAIRRGMLP